MSFSPDGKRDDLPQVIEREPNKASLTLALAHQRVAVGNERYDEGVPERNLETIANLWTTYLNSHYPGKGVEILPSDVGMMMVLLKVARVIANPFHEDSYVDIAGYAALTAEVVE